MPDLNPKVRIPHYKPEDSTQSESNLTELERAINAIPDSRYIISQSDTATSNTQQNNVEEDNINFTVPIMRQGQSLWVDAHGHFIQNQGSQDRDLRCRLYLGSTAFLVTDPITFTTSTSRRRWTLHVRIFSRTDTTQTASAELFFSAADSTANTWPQINSTQLSRIGSYDALAEDTRVPLSFRFTSAITSTGTRSFACHGYRAFII